MSRSNSNNGTKRRRVLKQLGLLGVAGAGAGAGVVLTSRPAFAADSFTADPVSLTSNSGNVKDVYLSPSDLNYTWNGLDSDPKSVTFTLYVDQPGNEGSSNTGTTVGNMDTLGTESDSDVSGSTTEGLEGSDTFSFSSQYSLINDGSWAKSDFEASNNGGSKTVSTIEVVVEATLTTDDGNTYTNKRRDSFDVTVNNQSPGFGGSGGNASTGGEAPSNNNK